MAASDLKKQAKNQHLLNVYSKNLIAKRMFQFKYLLYPIERCYLEYYLVIIFLLVLLLLFYKMHCFLLHYFA
jgi:hypothetical protein